MSTFTKQPRDVLDYDVDLSDWFQETPEDDIEAVEITVTCFTEDEPTLMVGPAPHPAYVLMGANPVRFKVWAGGGTDGADYMVNCLIRTEQDRVKEIEFKIKVRDR